MEEDVAFIGGIDLCHGRGYNERHRGDPQPIVLDRRYGPQPAWHDVQLEVRGPAVGDLSETFRERWADPTPLEHRTQWWARIRRSVPQPRPASALRPLLPDPPSAGMMAVQVLRTYPRKRPPFPFAPRGERSVARAYAKALARARSLIYVEDQYLWSTDVARFFAEALRRSPELRLIAVVPRYPDRDGALSGPLNRIGQQEALAMVREAGGDRVGVYDLENEAGRPIYVHGKLCVIDDVWLAVGSDNLNRRSWTHDSEAACAVLDPERDERHPADPGGLGDGARVLPRTLRLASPAHDRDHRPFGDGLRGVRHRPPLDLDRIDLRRPGRSSERPTGATDASPAHRTRRRDMCKSCGTRNVIPAPAARGRPPAPAPTSVGGSRPVVPVRNESPVRAAVLFTRRHPVVVGIAVLAIVAIAASAAACGGTAPAVSCPSSALRGVYHSYRLHVLGTCRWYAGKVERINHEDDGDYHVDIAPAAGMAGFLDHDNYTEQHGQLVTEIMPGQHFPALFVGEGVRVFGTWVYDANHGWNEVHPIWAFRIGARTYVSLPPVTPVYGGSDGGGSSGGSGVGEGVGAGAVAARAIRTTS